MEYEVKGLICIDSAKTMPDWTNSTETAAYNMTAFLADSIYGYVEAYTEQQKIDKKNHLLETEITNRTRRAKA